MSAHQGGKQKRTKATFFSLFDTQTLGQPSFTPPHTDSLPSGTPLQQFTRIIQVNNSDPGFAPLTCAPHNNRQMAATPRPPLRFVWLRFIQGKVASANMRATSAAAHSHLKQPGSCLLDISRLPSFPHPQTAMEAHIPCNTNSCLTDIFL